LPPREQQNGIIVSTPNELDLFEIRDEVRSKVVDISLFVPLPKGSFKAEICLETELRERESKDDLCLGFFNEQKGRWECEDECLKKDANRNSQSDKEPDSDRDGASKRKQTLCGKTDHFTVFSILLSGGSVKGSKCGDTRSNYVTGTWEGDSALVGSLIGAMILIVFVVVILSYLPAVKVFIFGKEGIRIRKIRGNSMAFE